MTSAYHEMIIDSLLSEFHLDRDDYHTITVVEQGAGYPPVMVCQAHEYGIRVICQNAALPIVLSDQDSSLWSGLLFKLPRHARRTGKSQFLSRDSRDRGGDTLIVEVIGRDRGNTGDWVFGKKSGGYALKIQGNFYLREVALAMMSPEVQTMHLEREKHLDEQDQD